jgi:hypothetical protein
LIELVVTFLQVAHNDVQPYTVRAGIQIIQYTLKLEKITGNDQQTCLYSAIQQVLGDDALQYV